MICKHFNLSYLQVRDELTLWEYLPLLAVAADEEEREPYDEAVTTAIAFHDPKRLKHWKFSSPDKAGTKSSGKSAVIGTMLSLVQGQITEPITDTERISKAEEYVKATGKVAAYLDKEGRLFDKEGKPTEKTPLTFVIPLELPVQ